MALFAGDPSAPTRFGEDVANVGDNTGLFLKVFGGEVFAAFAEATVTMDKHYTRTINAGKSAQFPRTWKVDAEYHTAGQEMLGQDTDETEKVITIDGLLTSHVGIYDLDDAMSHFDVRGIYSRELGLALARTFDKNVFRQIALSARETITSPFPSGKQIADADLSLAGSESLATTGNDRGVAIWKALRKARTELLDKNVPETTPVYCALPPTEFDELKYAVEANGNFVFASKDYNSQVGGQSQRLFGMMQVEDILVMRSNLLPNTDESASTSVLSKYRGDYSLTLGLVWIPEAVGTVKLVDMGMEAERDVRRQETFMVAKMAVGHGSLRNEGAIELRRA